MTYDVVTPAEVIARYNAGVRLFENIEIEEQQSLRDAKLSGAHFRNFWLHSTDFHGADLRDAVFENGNLKCIDFRGADLRGAAIRHCVLCGSDFKGAKIEGSSVVDTGWYGNDVTDLAPLVA